MYSLSANTQSSKCISRSCQPHILVFLFTDVHLYVFAWLESRVSVVFGNMVLLLPLIHILRQNLEQFLFEQSSSLDGTDTSLPLTSYLYT